MHQQHSGRTQPPHKRTVVKLRSFTELLQHLEARIDRGSVKLRQQGFHVHEAKAQQAGAGKGTTKAALRPNPRRAGGRPLDETLASVCKANALLSRGPIITFLLTGGRNRQHALRPQTEPSRGCGARAPAPGGACQTRTSRRPTGSATCASPPRVCAPCACAHDR